MCAQRDGVAIGLATGDHRCRVVGRALGIPIVPRLVRVSIAAGVGAGCGPRTLQSGRMARARYSPAGWPAHNTIDKRATVRA